MKSRVKGDFQARFRENAMVKVHGVTRLAPIIKKIRIRDNITRKVTIKKLKKWQNTN